MYESNHTYSEFDLDICIEYIAKSPKGLNQTFIMNNTDIEVEQ